MKMLVPCYFLTLLAVMATYMMTAADGQSHVQRKISLIKHGYAAENPGLKCPADITELALTSALKPDCEVNRPPCKYSKSKYRTNDGTCNNKFNKGAKYAEIDRLLLPTYEDGTNSPKVHAGDGNPLPSARRLVVDILKPKDVFVGYTIGFFQWGQWTSHDMLSTSLNSNDIHCCGDEGEPISPQEPNCFPIQVPPNDPKQPGTCMDFVRTLAANCSKDHVIKPRLHTNDVTTFMDTSTVYGSDDDQAAAVREPGSHLLRTKYLVFLPEANAGCNKRQGTTDYCFLAGDHRPNQHTYLAAMHTLWVREHNRIAKELKRLNPKAAPEKIFQTAKKIVNAINQAITYNEYLTALLGKEDAERWKLTSISGRSSYNPEVNPSLVEEFTTAAFRLGHSQTPSEFPIGNKSVPLRYLFGNSGFVLDHFEDIIAAMAGQSPVVNQGSQAVDKYFTEELTNYLFYNETKGRGEDLASVNIQRGRDHGLPPYAKVRKFCCLPPVKGFNDTEALGPDGYELANYYNSVEDIDLYTGILYEPTDRGLAGPTIRCLVGLQFHRIKHGDKHFFDNEQPTAFNDDQVASIRRVTFAHIVCHHTKLFSIPENAFRFPSPTNELVDCSKLKENGLDLTLFV